MSRIPECPNRLTRDGSPYPYGQLRDGRARTGAHFAVADKALVKYDKAKTTPEKMIAAIKKAGYSAEVRKDKNGEQTPERDAKKSS